MAKMEGALFAKLVSENDTITEISRILNLDRSTVRKKLKKYGLKI